MPKKQSFEYDYFELPATTSPDAMVQRLNVLGALGWQVASTYFGGGSYRIWMTRETLDSQIDKPV